MKAHNRILNRFTPVRGAAIAALALCCALGACAPLEGNNDDLAPPRAARASIPPAPVMTFARTPPQITVKTPVITFETEERPGSSPGRTDDAIRPSAKAEERGIWEEVPPAPNDAGVVFDFPVIMNRQVEHYLTYFQTDLRRRFSHWLGRASRYLPMIREKLRDAGLPEDLAYLPLIESGFNLNAYSPASAVGPWQFMRGTAKQYGLTVNEYVDERRDPIKSTQAAVAYLGDLYEEFGSWHLAVAAYNAGGGRIRRATQKYETDDFWEIARTNHLSSETQQYVPKLIAAIMIAREPEKYGFTDIACDEKFCYETVYVPRRTALAAVSLASNIDLEVLEDLNSELRLGMTPPNPPVYALKVPPGTKDTVLRNLSRVRAVTVTKFKDHQVRTGDTIPRLCKQYGIPKGTLLKANNLRKAQIRIGQRLRIPYQTTAYTMVARAETPHAKEGGKKTGKDTKKQKKADSRRIVHRIRAGETIATLAERYKVSVAQIVAWNRLKNPRQLKVGQQVVLYLETAATLGRPASPLTTPDAAAEIRRG